MSGAPGVVPRAGAHEVAEPVCVEVVPVTRTNHQTATLFGGRFIHAPSAMGNVVDIRLDKLERPEVLALLHEHLGAMEHTAPAESRHALDLAGLRGQDVTFWSAWDGPSLAGFGALKALGPDHGEIKSMRTSVSYLRRGVASAMLRHIIQAAGIRGYARLSLETGSMAYFEPARRLYARFGFQFCEPFGDYNPDPNSVFMTLLLAPGV